MNLKNGSNSGNASNKSGPVPRPAPRPRGRGLIVLVRTVGQLRGSSCHFVLVGRLRKCGRGRVTRVVITGEGGRGGMAFCGNGVIIPSTRCMSVGGTETLERIGTVMRRVGGS